MKTVETPAGLHVPELTAEIEFHDSHLDGVWAGFIWDRDPPPDILRRLREIHPRAGLRWIPGYFGDPPAWDMGMWWEPNRAVIAQAELAMERYWKLPPERRDPARLMKITHTFEGWRSVFRIEGREPDARDVQEFRFRNWEYERRFEEILEEHDQEFKRREEEEDQDLTDMIDAIQSDGAMWRYVSGGFSFVSSGLPGG